MYCNMHLIFIYSLHTLLVLKTQDMSQGNFSLLLKFHITISFRCKPKSNYSRVLFKKCIKQLITYVS